MSDSGDKILSRMPQLLRKIQCGPLLNRDYLPPEVRADGKGVYVFYEHGKPLYVGLSDRLRGRIQEHGYKSSEKATFAFIFTREIWGLWNDEWKGPLPKNPDYNVKLGKGSLAVTVRPTKKALLEKKQIKQDSWSQIERVKKMQVRVIETKDEYEQAMFEVFAAYILNTPYNDFKPH